MQTTKEDLQSKLYFRIDHAHLAPVWNKPWDIEKTAKLMRKRKVNAIFAVGYNNDVINKELWPLLLRGIDEYLIQPNRKYNIESDNLVAKISSVEKENGEEDVYLFRGQEVRTKRGFDVLNLLPAQEIEPLQYYLGEITKKIKEEGAIAILNTPYLNNKNSISNIDRGLEHYLEKVCENKEKRPNAIDWDAYLAGIDEYLLKRIYKKRKGINEKSVELAKRQGIKIFHSTDLHAQYNYQMKYIATAFIAIAKEKINFTNKNTVTESVKSNIIERNYEGFGKPISRYHLFMEYPLHHISVKLLAKLNKGRYN